MNRTALVFPVWFCSKGASKAEPGISGSFGLVKT